MGPTQSSLASSQPGIRVIYGSPKSKMALNSEDSECSIGTDNYFGDWEKVLDLSKLLHESIEGGCNIKGNNLLLQPRLICTACAVLTLSHNSFNLSPIHSKWVISR